MKLRWLFLFCLLVTSLRAADSTWLTDHDAALAKAKAEQKQVLIDFTGTAWCPPCIALHKEIMTQPAFATWSKDMVLLTLDFPPSSARTPDKVAKDPELARLMALKTKYAVPGFPTVIVLAPDGTELGRSTGFESGMPAARYFAEFGLKPKR